MQQQLQDLVKKQFYRQLALSPSLAQISTSMDALESQLGIISNQASKFQLRLSELRQGIRSCQMSISQTSRGEEPQTQRDELSLIQLRNLKDQLGENLNRDVRKLQFIQTNLDETSRETKTLEMKVLKLEEKIKDSSKRKENYKPNQEIQNAVHSLEEKARSLKNNFQRDRKWLQSTKESYESRLEQVGERLRSTRAEFEQMRNEKQRQAEEQVRELGKQIERLNETVRRLQKPS